MCIPTTTRWVSSIPVFRRLSSSSTLALISALALSLMMVSSAPYRPMWFINAIGYLLSLLPSPSTEQKPDFHSKKNCAAVDPLSTAGQPGPYMVSVATASFLLITFSAGFGALCHFHNFSPFTGPNLPNGVVFSNVFSKVLVVLLKVSLGWLSYHRSAFNHSFVILYC